MVITICQILKDGPQGTIKHDLSEELLSEKLYGEQLEMYLCFFANSILKTHKLGDQTTR